MNVLSSGMSADVLEQQDPVAGSDTPESSDTNAPSVLFVAACIILPILWGVVVHRVFRRLRGREKPSEVQNDSVWPDYQI